MNSRYQPSRTVGRQIACSQEGFILVPVLLALLLIASIAFLMAREGAMNLNQADNEAQTQSLRYVAEAGLAHALWQANDGSCADYGIDGQAFDSYTYTVTFTPDNGSPVDLAIKAEHSDGASYTLRRNAVKIYASPTSITMQPDGSEGIDTYLYEWKPDRNYGKAEVFRIDNVFINSEARSLLTFELSAIPGNVKIDSAVLDLYQNSDTSAGGQVGVHLMKADWIEGTQTGGINTSGASWDESTPGKSWSGNYYDSNVSYASAMIIAGTKAWYQWDISELVKGWKKNTYNNAGFVLLAETTGTEAYFASSDNADLSLHPKLTIIYACECGTTCM